MDEAAGQRLRLRLDEEFAEAQRLKNELEKFCYFRTAEDEYSEEEEWLSLQLKDAHGQIAYLLMGALESLGMQTLLGRLVEWFDSKDYRPTDLHMAPWVGELYSPSLGVLRSYFAAVEPFLSVSQAGRPIEYEKQRLRSFLLGTPTIIHEANITPSNEAEVRREVFRVMRHFFPDSERELPIAKPLKNCKPDFGVPSLKTAIEYKFVDSPEELKSHLGGIYEDIHAYEGSADGSGSRSERA